MTSTAAPASSKTSVLSYAERARKAQGMQTPGTTSTTSRIGSTSTTLATSTSTGTTSPGPRSSVSSGVTVSSKAVKPNTGLPLPSSLATPSPAVTGQANGEGRLSGDPERKQVSGATAQQQTTPKAPVPNIWAVRKEQLAASRSIVPPTSTAANIGTAKPQTTVAKAAAPESVSGSHSVASVTHPNQPNTASGPSISDPSSGKSLRCPSSGEMAPPTAIPIDSEAWPEVGKVQNPEHQESQTASREGKEETTTSNKKGEKTKWIPIPAAELQAAADAVLKTSKSQSRRTSRGPSRNHQDSRGHNTRNPSGRNSTSQSTSQSRVHSRSGSVQSSPRFSRGRRLPGDDSQPSKLNGNHTTASGLTATPRYSGHGSPQRSSDNSMPDPQTAKSGDVGSGIHPVPQGTHHMSIPPHPYMMYPPPPGFNSMPAPIHYPLTSANGSPSMQPPGPFPHGPITYPPYPMYGGYDFTSAPLPPMFWPGMVPSRSGHHSPAYPAPFPSDPSSSSPFQSASSSQINGNAAPGVTSPPTAESSGLTESASGLPSQARDAGSSLGEKPVLFGSIGIAVSEGLSEKPAGPESLENSFSKFSIGVSQNDIAPGLRSRSKSSKDRPRSSDEASGPTEPVDTSKIAAKAEGTGGKWEFGTTSTLIAQPSDEHGPAARLSPMSGSVSPAQLPIIPGVPPSAPTQNLDAPVDLDTEFKVKDFGYGFGRPAVPPASSEQVNVDPHLPRHDGDRHPRGDGLHYGGKGRRPGPRDEGFDRERGGRGGRRGRGSFNSGRGQGGRSHQRNSSFQGPPPLRQHQFTHGTPPSFQHHIPPSNDASPGPYFGGRPQIAQYLPPHGYDTYGLSPNMPAASPPSSHLSPPVPVPVTTLSFPLDPTRYYLLGQLEYYLSAQNMAQDFFLRQRMDARGWIAIPLIASFNRVRQLTMDLNIVREVLCISSIVQVHNNWVRMGGWEQWVLPDASPSSVDEGEVGIPYAGGIPPAHYGELLPSGSQLLSRPTIVVDEHGHMHKIYPPESQGEEEDEEEVEFVMGKDS